MSKKKNRREKTQKQKKNSRVIVAQENLMSQISEILILTKQSNKSVNLIEPHLKNGVTTIIDLI